MRDYTLRNILFVLFAVSGFTGLIYESIWSHYLKLFLGHAAYAQALVLAIFMGGMALGAWLASRLVSKWTNLLIAYAIVEGIIGFMGIFFHPVFEFILDFSFGNIIPGLDSPTSVQLYKWSISILLILPQSILLGTTFPLMSNGIIRLIPAMEGGSLSMLYFTNSFGAAIGVLVAGFLLISAFGLPGTILLAGIINTFLAIGVYILAKGKSTKVLTTNESSNVSKFCALLLIASFITGMASFIYELAWIRMLSMVLGASTHSFELMLSAFILGLAFGGLFIKRFIDHLKDPLLTAGYIQIVMGICALSTIPLYNFTFDLMAYFMSALKPTDAGYNFFTFASHFIAILVMLPTTFCAGMTLPLFTKILLGKGYGEKSIGQIYASNTMGAIVGVAFTIFIAMPSFGLKFTMVIGAGLDMVLGIILLMNSLTKLKRFPAISLAICISTFLFSSLLVKFDYNKMSSSVFRTGTISKEDSTLLFHKDGKTATIHVTASPDGWTTIMTNSKPDASIFMGDTDSATSDEPTMILAAAIPLAINPSIKTSANIGMGSGLTTHTLLAWPGIERVDTIEIESAMVEGANQFRPKVERAFTDPRSHIYIEDAKTHFSSHKEIYDLIISEPSNPWVSGVSSLFSDEFYQQIKNYLSEGGMLVQWLQTYEINLELVLSVFRALNNNFKYYSIYAITDSDLILVAKNNGAVDIPDEIIFSAENMRQDLSHVGIDNLEDIKARFIADEQLIRPLIKLYNPPVNSDYFPILDINAPRARFKQEDAYELTRLRMDPIPLINMLKPHYENTSNNDINHGISFSTTRQISIAQYIYDYVKNGKQNIDEFNYTDIDLLIRLSRDCGENFQSASWKKLLLDIAYNTIGYLNTSQLNEIWEYVTPECVEYLQYIDQQWLAFILALSNRNPELIAEKAYLLLQYKSEINIKQKKFLFGSLMLARLLMNNHEAVVRMWIDNVETLFNKEKPPLSLLILYGLALENYSPG